MDGKQPSTLDKLLRLRLSNLSPEAFERFFVDFLNAGVALTISREGQPVKKRVILASTYAPGSGRDQRGIDLRLEMEGREAWVIQCKRVKKWTQAETRTAIEEASQYPARHYFLAVACDTGHGVHDEVAKHPNWTLWNLDTICSLFKSLVPASKRRDVLGFLSSEEIRKFLPFATESLISPERFFQPFLGENRPLRHDWALVGRKEDLARLGAWAQGPQKALLLAARGGEGKTRLIREFCTAWKSENPGGEILFLNPHREGGDENFSWALQGEATGWMVIIDDAHRPEFVPQKLLARVQENPVAKIILVSRPQGGDSILSRLSEAGFLGTTIMAIPLPPLGKPAARLLAKQILTEFPPDQVEAFIQLTDANPFLVATAGGLLRSKRLVWGAWHSPDDFRRQVFLEFENENLNGVPDAERVQAARLLRLLALLSPVTLNRPFIETAGSFLKSETSIEGHLNFLRRLELVVGPDEKLRIVPDLFADFLVYETCFEPNRREPIWVTQVVERFPDQAALFLRNISEASWIAHLNGTKDDKLLEPLLAWQKRQFLGQSFIERSETLRSWSSFSVYLPKESIGLAELAIEEKTAPADSSPLANDSPYNNHAYVLEQIPGLLKPIVKYQDEFRRQALELLWELGYSRKVERRGDHPWIVIAEALKFDRYSSVEAVLSVLGWLEELIKKPAILDELAKPEPILRVLLEPCFSRSVDLSWNEGLTYHLSECEAPVETTQPIRDCALRIIAWVIEHGSVLAILDALGALEVAIRRAGRGSLRGLDDNSLPGYVARWSPERLKALALYEKTLEKHSDLVVRYEIRKTLRADILYEEDSRFADECRRILGLIPEDLPLAVVVALSPDYAQEFEDARNIQTDPDWFTKARNEWRRNLEMIADRLAAEHSPADALYNFIRGLAEKLSAAGYSPAPYPLFAALGGRHPVLGFELAEMIVAATAGMPLAFYWSALIDSNGIPETRRTELYERAVRSSDPVVRSALVRHLSYAVQLDDILAEKQQALLFSIAERASENEALHLLELIQECSDPNLPWACQLLDAIRLETLTPALLGALLSVLVPYRDRKSPLPRQTVQRVLDRFLLAQDLNFYQHGHAWEHLKKTYPLEVYRLFHERIVRAAARKYPGYRAVSHGMGRFRLPELAKQPQMAEICEDLWRRVRTSEQVQFWNWLWLYQAVVFEDVRWWHDRLQAEIAEASTKEELGGLTQLIGFEGSLIIFEFPEITESFLRRAEAIGGKDLAESIRRDLYRGAGPRGRGYTNGQLQKNYDYVEAEAVKASEKHALNDVLGPFYRWIVEIEQQARLIHKLQAEAQIADY